MPKGTLVIYRSEEEFDDLVDKLNALYHRYLPWKRKTARKEHKDLFGEVVKSGEVYFCRQMEAAWGSDLKLSRRSMERLLYAIFGSNPSLEQWAGRIQEERQRALMEEARRISEKRWSQSDEE